jgi:c-di-GMP-binding flagellar brake protein YcgR
MADEEVGPRPGINQRVHLRLSQWATSLPSRIEEIEDDGMLAVTATGTSTPLSGDAITVSWDSPTGVYELDTVVEGVRRREIPLWDLRPTGPGKLRQRRAHVRVPLFRRVEVVRYGVHHNADLVDLSEGGVQATVVGDVFVGVGDTVTVALPLEESDDDLILALNAQVVRVILEPDKPRRFSVRFIQVPLRDADALRREVFALEADARQSRVDR